MGSKKREVVWDPDWVAEAKAHEPDFPFLDGKSDLIRDIIETFDDEAQFLIDMRVYEQMSYRQIAERVGWSYEWVRTRILELFREIGDKYLEATKVAHLWHPDADVTIEETDVELILDYQRDGWVRYYTNSELEALRNDEL